jgi:hypothetical protein
MITAPLDVFSEVNSHPIAELWVMLGLTGDPKPRGNMISPFRDERHASFSIHSDGFAWNDHGGGLGGDGVEFVKVALDTNHAGVRDWWLERHGIDRLDGEISKRTLPQRPLKEPEPPRVIEWPDGKEPFEITPLALDAFARSRGLSYKGMHVAQAAGMLRFLKISGRKCFVVTDNSRLCAEIRAIDGSLFSGRKAYPLAGVSKAWPVGLAGMDSAPKRAGIWISEGSTDTLTALDLYARYKTHGGPNSWIVSGLLGASCKSLMPAAEGILRGRRVRLCPDGDDAGDRMAAHWEQLLLKLGCDVDVMEMPRGSDLSDVAGNADKLNLSTRLFA